jgi:hypothetical protein
MPTTYDYTETDYLALGHFLRREMYGVELNEDEELLATMSVMKFPEIEIPEVEYDIEVVNLVDYLRGPKGLISKDGWILKPEYEYIDDSDFFDNRAKVRFSSSNMPPKPKNTKIKKSKIRFRKIVKNGKYGLVDNNGREVVPLIYYNISRQYQGVSFDHGDSMVGVESPLRKNGIFDIRKQKEIIPTIYDFITEFNESNKSHFIVVNNEKVGIIDKNGDLLGKRLSYDSFCLDAYREYGGGYIKFQKDGKWGLIYEGLETGEGIVYDNITQLPCKGVFAVEKNKELYFINEKGERITHVK